MTAMRMATTDESSSRPYVPQRNTSASIASSYQTATPEQLQAAGIAPVVINDRSFRSRGARPAPQQQQQQQPQMSGYGPSFAQRTSGGPAQSQSQGLSPYHQQLLPARRGGANPNPPDYYAAAPEAYPSGRWPEARPHPQHLAPLPLDQQAHRTPAYDGMRQGSFGRDYPEVRSLPPDDHSEHYADLLASLTGSTSTDHSSNSNSGMSMGMGSSMKLPFHKSRSHSTLDPASLPLQSLSLSLQHHGHGHGHGHGLEPLHQHAPAMSSAFLPQLDMGRDGEDESEMDLYYNKPAAAQTTPQFPLIKSKTVPKLSSLGDFSSSPAGSPSMKMLARKLLGGGSNRDLNLNSFLPDEMAESVLGTPPAASARRTSRGPAGLAPLRSLGRLSPQVVPQESYFFPPPTDDDRFAWDAALDEDDDLGLQAIAEEDDGLTAHHRRRSNQQPGSE